MDDLAGIGKISESIERGTKEIRRLAYDFLNPSVKEAGQLIAEKIRFYRFINAIQTMQKAKQKLRTAGLPLQHVELKTLLPLLEGASLEDNSDMVEMWAGLLSSASVAGQSIVSFVYILKELSSIDAKVLDVVGRIGKNAMQINNYQYYGIFISDLEVETALNRDSLILSLGNLVRLGLVQRVYEKPAMTWGEIPLGTGKDEMAGLTPLGAAFLSACYGPDFKGNLFGPKIMNR